MKKTRYELLTEIRALGATLSPTRGPGDGSVTREVTATASAIVRKMSKVEALR